MIRSDTSNGADGQSLRSAMARNIRTTSNHSWGVKLTKLTKTVQHAEPIARDHDPRQPQDAMQKNFRVGKIMSLARAQREATPTERNSGHLLSLFETKAFEQHFQPESTILLHGHAADAVYLVVSGTIRCCTISEDGRRQIFRFAKKGEFVGVSDIDTWHFTAEAVDHVIVKSIPRSVVEQSFAVSIPLRQEIRALVCSQLECR